MVQRSPVVLWTKAEVERLLAWMEDNLEELRGKQSRWHKDVKCEVFLKDEHITIKKISDKVSNMKKQWKEAKALRDGSGWGIMDYKEDQSIKDALERKCPFFFRLDAIWGGRPNVKVLYRMDTINSTTQPVVQLASTPSVRAISSSPPQSPHIRSRSTSSSFEQQIIDLNIPPQSPMPPHNTQSPIRSPARSPTRSHTPSPTQSTQYEFTQRMRRATTKPPNKKPVIKEKRSIMHSIKELMESQRATEDIHMTKRLKMEREIEMEKIKSSERMDERKVEAEERIAKMQAESQVRQMEVVAQMIQQVIQVLRPTV